MANRSLKREMDAQVRADIQDRERMSTDYAQEEQGKMDIAEDYVGPVLAVATGGGLGGIRQMLGKKAIKFKNSGSTLASQIKKLNAQSDKAFKKEFSEMTEEALNKKREYVRRTMDMLKRMDKGESSGDLAKLDEFKDIKIGDLEKMRPVADYGKKLDAKSSAKFEKDIRKLITKKRIKGYVRDVTAFANDPIAISTLAGAGATADAMRRATADTAPPQDSFSDSFSKLRDLIRRNPEAENMVKINLDPIPRREQYQLPGED